MSEREERFKPVAVQVTVEQVLRLVNLPHFIWRLLASLVLLALAIAISS